MAEDNLDLVVKGFRRLSAADKTKFIEAILRWQREGVLNERIEKSHDSINMGPVASGCPCCGR